MTTSGIKENGMSSPEGAAIPFIFDEEENFIEERLEMWLGKE